MKNFETILNKYNKNNKYPVTPDNFEMNCKRYIKAIKDGRMICSIDKVSASGMSRTLRFVEMAKVGKTHYIYNFYQLFDILGYEKVKQSDYFRIHGCGMDMVFDTNYNMIHKLYHFGLISKKTCSILCQKTPHGVF